MGELLHLFNHKENGERANRIMLTIPYLYTIDFYDPAIGTGIEEVLIYGMYYDGTLIAKNVDDEERKVFFEDMCTEDLVNLHSLFTTQKVEYIF